MAGKADQMDWAQKLASEFFDQSVIQRWWDLIEDVKITCGPVFAAITVTPSNNELPTIEWRGEIHEDLPHFGEVMQQVSSEILLWNKTLHTELTKAAE